VDVVDKQTNKQLEQERENNDYRVQTTTELIDWAWFYVCATSTLTVLKVWVHSHGQHPGTYFKGWTPSRIFLGQRRMESIHWVNLFSGKLVKLVPPDVRF